MERAIVKYNNGDGALLCNGCRIIISHGYYHEDKEHYCSKCTESWIKRQEEHRHNPND